MDLESERAALQRRDADWSEAAYDGRDVERVLSYWTDDAVVMPPGHDSIVGRAAIRGFVESSFQTPGFSIRWMTTNAVLSPDGNVGYLVSRNRMTVNGPDGTPIVREGRAVTIWRKDSDGEWRCAVDIWNAESPTG